MMTTKMTVDPTIIRTLETISFRALPAIETRHYDGWVLRFARGYTRRANSVNPIYACNLDVERKIQFCEALYFERGMPTHFKLTAACVPSDLDDLLAKRGYETAGTTRVQTLQLSEIETTLNEHAKISNTLTQDWLDDYTLLNHVDAAHRRTLHDIVSRITAETCFMRLRHDNKTLAVGLGVVDEGRIGLFDVVTAEPYRRQGWGKALMLSLLHWGKQKAATEAYLQVVGANEPANQLYAGLGFREVYHYWYRSLHEPK